MKQESIWTCYSIPHQCISILWIGSIPASTWSIAISASGLSHCHHPVHCSIVQAHLITFITALEHDHPCVCVHSLVHHIFPSRYEMDVLIFHAVVPPLNAQLSHSSSQVASR